MTLLVAVCSGAWAQEVAADYDSSDWSQEQANAVIGTHGDVIISGALGSYGNVSGHWYLPIANNLKNSDNPWTGYLGISSTRQIEKISILYCPNGTDNTNLAWVAWGKSVTPNQYTLAHGTTAGTKSSKSWDNKVWEDIDLSETTAYTVYISRSIREFREIGGSSNISNFGAGKTINVLGIKVWLKAAGPTINTQPQSASYVSGQTIDALTVDATASAGTLTYQWYSCDDANKNNAATIGGATSASYTPTAAGFYYVTVTDGNGSVDSEVVEISISAATAPTINVSGAPANAIVVGTEVTLTATVTGVPTPTLQWYSNTTPSNTGGTAIDGATSETYAPSTAAAGTYYFYAVATNSEGEATSALQTIVVKEQVVKPTITPNSAYFETSQEVTLACATEDAAILYSTDGGTTWNTYTDALTFAATTTIQAKATKDGYIDSEVATATFTKFVKTELAEVSTATTWDWTSWDRTVTLNETTTPSKNDTYTYSDIAMINNLTLPSGFKGDAITFKGVYPVRSKKSQDGTWTIKVAAPGTLAVTFSDTGTKLQEGYTAETQPKRYLYINGVKTDYYTQRTGSANDQKTVTLSIAAGENVITTADADNNYQAICLYKLVYTPVTSTTVEVGEKLYRTFASKYPLDFTTPVSGLTAYKANVTGDNVTFEEVTGKVPAGEGLLLKATAADTYTISVPAGEVATIDNALVGVTKETTIEGAGIFVLYADDTHPIGFYKTEATSFTVGANTAYLPANTSARTFIALDEETTGIGATLMNSEKVNSEVYNLNGQRVAQPSKGLYIVNGKKVVVK